MAITMVPVKLLAAGRYLVTLGANAVTQYNPDNVGVPYNDPNGTPVPGVWRSLMAVSTSGGVSNDGFGVRILFSGGAGTSRWSKWKSAGSSNLATPGNSFLTEVSSAQIPISAAGAAPSGGISTITAAAHGLAVGDIVTFAGSAVTAYNDTNFVVLSVPTANTFTIATGTLAQLA